MPTPGPRLVAWLKRLEAAATPGPAKRLTPEEYADAAALDTAAQAQLLALARLLRGRGAAFVGADR